PGFEFLGALALLGCAAILIRRRTKK
ncbi:MAG: Heimdall-CTERM domain-containing surface protein, partial [Candidatus Hodarchaeota archaeon]